MGHRARKSWAVKRPSVRGRQPESLVVNACIKWLWAHGCFVWRNNTGALKNQEGKTVRYGCRGSADILGLTPSGRFLAVECKSAKGEMSLHQELFRQRVQEKRGIYLLARSVDDLETSKLEILDARASA